MTSKPHISRRELMVLLSNRFVASPHAGNAEVEKHEQAIVAAIDGLFEQLEAAHKALEFIRAIQRTRLGWYRDQGVKFMTQPNGSPDPDNWESVAFWTYTDLCEAESTAAAVLNPATTFHAFCKDGSLQPCEICVGSCGIEEAEEAASSPASEPEVS